MVGEIIRELVSMRPRRNERRTTFYETPESERPLGHGVLEHKDGSDLMKYHGPRLRVQLVGKKYCLVNPTDAEIARRVQQRLAGINVRHIHSAYA